MKEKKGNARRMIYGTSDEKLRKDALAKDMNYDTLVKTAQSYEQSRRSAGAMKVTTTTVERPRAVEYYSKQEVDEMLARVTTPSRFSERSKGQDRRSNERCPNCPKHYRPHAVGKCPAQGQTCKDCKKRGHFAKSAACNRAVNVSSLETEYDYEGFASVEIVEIGWMRENKNDNIVTVYVNGERMELMVDSGSRKTLIPEQVYKYSVKVGPLRPSTKRFRPYGTQTLRKTTGEAIVQIKSRNGATIDTTVYVVDGHLRTSARRYGCKTAWYT